MITNDPTPSVMHAMLTWYDTVPSPSSPHGPKHKRRCRHHNPDLARRELRRMATLVMDKRRRFKVAMQSHTPLEDEEDTPSEDEEDTPSHSTVGDDEWDRVQNEDLCDVPLPTPSWWTRWWAKLWM